MLGNCPLEEIQETILRLAAALEGPLADRLRVRGVALQNISEAVSALETSEMPFTAEEIVDEAFRA